MEGQRISIFPLAGALLFPDMQLPLHIFEPRYRALISDALARARLIGMVQPRNNAEPAEIYSVGCLGRVSEFEALADGRYNIILTGVARFHVLRELPVTTLFRQVEGVVEGREGAADEALAPVMRAALEMEARRFAERLGYVVDWTAVSRLDDASLVNGIAQVAPFDVASKQALLEAMTLADRADQTIQLMQFYGLTGNDGDVTLQ